MWLTGGIPDDVDEEDIADYCDNLEDYFDLTILFFRLYGIDGMNYVLENAYKGE